MSGRGRTPKASGRAPLPDPTEAGAGELRKSGATRRRIMNAAVHCLAHYGYAGTNAVTVAEQADMTRSAMLYHFPTRMALIEATVHFVMRERIAKFEAIVSHIEHGPDWRHQAIEIAWAQNQTDDYKAYCELANAARTDPDLAAVFEPAMDAYDRARRETAALLFSPAEQAAEGFHLRRDITRFLLDGIACHGWFAEDGPIRVSAMIEFLKALTDDKGGRTLLRQASERAAESAARAQGGKVAPLKPTRGGSPPRKETAASAAARRRRAGQ